MQRFYEDEEVIFENTFYSDKAKTTKVDPASVTLTLQGPDGVDVSVSVSQNGSRPTNLGKYIASHIVDKYGVWQWRWVTSSPTIVKQGEFEVIQQNP